jgi:hypothetical protein
VFINLCTLAIIHLHIVATIHNRSVAIIYHFFSPSPRLHKFNLWCTGKSGLCCSPAETVSRPIRWNCLCWIGDVFDLYQLMVAVFVSFLFILLLARVTQVHK